MTTPSRRAVVPLVMLLGASSLSAIAADRVEQAFFEPLPSVLTLSRMPLALNDTPGAVTVIDQELIRASGYRDIGRLFRLVPGMQVGQEHGNDQWVTYHGLGLDYPNQMQLLIDGRSVNTPYFDWGKLRLALDDIERIEVVRGSDAAAYGSNAFLGIVNILTRDTAGKPGAAARVTAGHRGIGDVSGQALLRAGPLGLRITAAHQRDDGFSGLHDARHMNALNLRGDLHSTGKSELTVHAGLLDGRRDIGYPNTPFDSNAERELEYRDAHVHLRWRRALAADNELSFAWSYNREYTRERWTASVPAQPVIYIPIDADRHQRRSNFELQHRFGAGTAMRFSWGLEWRRDTLDAPLFFYGQGTRRQTVGRVFANFEWRLSERWLLQGGSMAERQAGSGVRHAPRLFVTWQPDAARSWRLGYSRAWRQPSQFERQADVRVIDPASGALVQQRHIANANIRPQRIDVIEAGHFSTYAGGRGAADVRLFRERITDLIWRTTVAPPPGSLQETLGLGSAQWDNLGGRIELTGIEYQLRWRPWHGGKLIFNHALISASARHRPLEKTVAPYTASLSLLQRFGRWNGMVSLLRQGPLDAGSSDVQGYQYVVPAYTTLDLSIARKLALGDSAAELRLTGTNLLGRHQELAHRPLQQQAGSRPVNQVEPQLYLSLHATF